MRIALADDEPEMLVYLREILSVLGHEVVAAASTGQELVAQCRSAGPDLLITDVKMPDMDGIEAAVQIRRFASIPVVLITGYSDADLIERALADHIQVYLIKPIKRADLEAAISLAVRWFREFQALATELTETEQRERQRLARVLHDDLQQILFAARMQLRAARSEAANDDRLLPPLMQVDELLKEALAATRSLTSELSPPPLSEGNFAKALGWLGERMHEKFGLAVAIDAELGIEPASDALRTVLFETVRELLFNVVKHAQTDRARVEMQRFGERRVRLVVSDGGVGFDPTGLVGRKADSESFGLATGRRRFELLGGSMEIESAPGQGTRITLTAPGGRRIGTIRPRAIQAAPR